MFDSLVDGYFRFGLVQVIEADSPALRQKVLLPWLVTTYVGMSCVAASAPCKSSLQIFRAEALVGVDFSG
jgi:hypothetical protein